jgi:hypothetical protein
VHWSDLINLAAVLAALGAAYYARQAVLDTKELRRDDRLAAVAAAASSYGTTLTQATSGMVVVLELARANLETAIEIAGETLPKTRELLESVGISSSPEAIAAASAAALAEIAAQRRRHD